MSVSRPHLDDTERRHRLAVRHALAPSARRTDLVEATRAVVALHSTEPATVHLSLHARTRDLTVGQVEQALYQDRSLVKQLAMRRTLWTVEPGLVPALLGSASARVAAQERRKVAQDVEKHGVAADGQAWLDRAQAAVLDRLRDGSELSAVELRHQVPELAGAITADLDKKYGGTAHLAPRVLTALGATGAIVRGANGGHWRTSRPQWTSADQWLGAAPPPLDQESGYLHVIGAWLARFGPATENDIVWWLGATKAVVRRALTSLAAEEVSLEGDRVGFVLPGDTELTDDPGEWAALLPVLDPTTMGWKERDFYLPPQHVAHLFDSNGNGGTTAWWNGRVVGAWVQEQDSTVRVLLRDGEQRGVGAAGRAALEQEAARVTAFLDGTVIASVYKSALMKGEPLP